MGWQNSSPTLESSFNHQFSCRQTLPPSSSHPLTKQRGVHYLQISITVQFGGNWFLCFIQFFFFFLALISASPAADGKKPAALSRCAGDKGKKNLETREKGVRMKDLLWHHLAFCSAGSWLLLRKNKMIGNGGKGERISGRLESRRSERDNKCTSSNQCVK